MIESVLYLVTDKGHRGGAKGMSQHGYQTVSARFVLFPMHNTLSGYSISSL